MSGHVVVCGMGRVGYRVVDLLCRLGEAVTVVTQPTREDWVLDAHAPRLRVLVGDARNQARLREAGILEASALIAATDHDLGNVEIVLDARQLRPDLPLVVRLFDPRVRTVLRMFDADLASKVQAALTVDAALSASRIAAPTFAAAALYPDVRYALVLDDWLLAIRHRVVGTDWAGRTPAQVRAAEDVAVLMRRGPRRASLRAGARRRAAGRRRAGARGGLPAAGAVGAARPVRCRPAVTGPLATISGAAAPPELP
jgi:Trk K+ transport system NAD-binding subunit